MKLHWLLVKFRTEFKIILGTVKIFQCLAPSYIYQFVFLLINICDKILETQVIMFDYASFQSKPTLGDRVIDPFNLSAAPKL